MKPILKPIRFLLINIPILCLSVNAFGQENLSLSDAITQALDYHYDIRILRQNEEIAEIDNTWGAAGRYPIISFGLASNNRADFNEDSNITSNSVTPELSLNWLLFDGFAIRIRKEKLETLSDLSKGNTVVLVEQTLQSTILAYYKALLEKEKLLVLQEVMDLSRDRYDYVMTGKEIGSAVTYDVLQAKNSWLEDKAGFLLQEVIHTNAIRDLNYHMGVQEDISYNLTDEFTAELTDFDLETLRAKMLSNNNTLRNQYINEMLLKKEIALAKSLYYPSLSLRSGLGTTTSRMKFEGANATTANSSDMFANITLNYTLFDGGARQRALRIAKIQEETSQIVTTEMKHSLTNQLAQIYDLYTVRKELYNVAEENIAAARLNMEISEDKFRAGTINSFNYRDVQLIYLNAAFGRLQAIYNLIDTDNALLRITGGIITEY